MRTFSLALAAALLAATPASAQQTDPAQIGRIIDEGTSGSEVMRIAQVLTDVIGPRLTNSPGMRKAEAWTMAKFQQWSLADVRKEGFEFGRGWWEIRSSARMVSPRLAALAVTPITWTPGTNGTLSAPVVLATLRGDGDLAQWKGKLGGKIVLISEAKDAEDPAPNPLRRWTADELRGLQDYEQPRFGARGRGAAGPGFAERRNAFLKAEGALAFVTMSGRDGKLVHGSASQFRKQDAPGLPGFELAAEDYRRLARLLASGAAPVVELMSEVGFDDSDTNAYNILADIPGTARNGEYVMAGAHLDSWAAGDGAADNAAGSAMVMEAARILKAMGVKPKRTIRFALWAGEEQGLLGSMDYVERHIATRPGTEGMTGMSRFMGWNRGWPITPKPGHKLLTAYFNIDNGSGRIRGINTQNNAAVVPIFQRWLKPFGAMGAETVALRRVGGTDHVFFDAVGIPAFQFIQDPLDYNSRLHHTNVDTFDHLKAEDMRQGAIILAAFLLNAANADAPLPRVPFPTEPKPSDEFYPFAEAAH